MEIEVEKMTNEELLQFRKAVQKEINSRKNYKINGFNCLDSLINGLCKKISKVYVAWEGEINQELVLQPYNTEYDSAPIEGWIDYINVYYGSFDQCNNDGERFEELFEIDYRDISDDESYNRIAALLHEWLTINYLPK